MRARAAFFAVSATLVSFAAAFACSSGSSGLPEDVIALPDRVPLDDATNDAEGDSVAPGNDAGGAWSPAALGPRLVFWLDATKGVVPSDAGRDGATAIVSWADQSGNDNDAVQPAANLQPVIVGGARPFVGFDGVGRIAIADNASLRWGKEDFALAAVFRYTNPNGSFGLVVGKYDIAPPFAGPNLYGNYFNPASTSVVARVDGTHVAASKATGCNDGKPHLVVVRRSGTTLELRFDGDPSSNPDAGAEGGGPIDVTAPDAAVFLGNRPNGSAGLRGEIGEVIGVHGALTDAEALELESYLRTKYGL